MVIYNPTRPPYWEKVSVREAFTLLINYWKCVPDKAQVDVMKVLMLNNEFSNLLKPKKMALLHFWESGKHFANRTGRKRYACAALQLAYWDRSQPKSSVQLIVLVLPKAEIVKG